MKKYYSVFFGLSINFSSFAQAWVWDEVAREAEVSKPVTFLHIFIFVIICVFIWLGVKTSKNLRSFEKVKYLKIRKTTVTICIIITVLLPLSILAYFDFKRAYLEDDAKDFLNNIINDSGAYIEIDKSFSVGLREIQPRDNQLPNNQIADNWAYRTILEQGAIPYDGIMRCFNIGTLGYQVIFAGDAKRRGCSSEDEPALFHGWIRPFRIRYYSTNNVDPNRDLRDAFNGFIRSFIWDHDAEPVDDITTEFFRRSLNEYYEIRHIPRGDEMWVDNKLYYENDIVQERTYEYKTLNYGNYDITYCISRPCKLGVCEKYTHGSIFGKEIFDKIHLVKRNEALAKCCAIWIVFLSALSVIFAFGNPLRK
ncbi:MAG: hypothetical protein K2I26_04480 [Paramuribaculum sp.]|nr:hypothetical protein [Paramuribaculum sp.]